MLGNYKAIQVNEEVTFQGVKMPSCYCVPVNVDIRGLHLGKAEFILANYESKAKCEENKAYRRVVDEIPNRVTIEIGADFIAENIMTIVSLELKKKLLSLNPTWSANNLVVE